MRPEILNHFKQLDIKTAVTVGKFDGLHVGHRLLIDNITHSGDLAPLLFTFSGSPRSVLSGEEDRMILSSKERIALAGELGIRYFAELAFDEKMMHMSAESFLDTLLGSFNMKKLCVGDDFRFGYKGSGDVDYLTKASKEKGFELSVCKKVVAEGREVSSTCIRELISDGDIEKANRLLARCYTIAGEVVHGAGLGHKLGIPTINVIPPGSKLLPRLGVYATKVTIGDKTYSAVTNVGFKPTVSNNGSVCSESHLIDTDEDFYGKTATISFEKMLRPEMKFSGIDELRSQMSKDIETAKALMK